MNNDLSKVIVIFGIMLLHSPFANAESAANPIKGAINSLELLADLLSNKISAKYNPVDQETFGKLSKDLISIGAQKSSTMLSGFNKGDVALSVNAERHELAYSNLWEKYTGLDQQSVLIPALGISYGMTKETLANITYKQFRADRARLIGLTLRNSFSIPLTPMQASIGISHSRLINSAPLQLETTSVDLVGTYAQKTLKPYLGVGIVHGRSEFRSAENMKFSGNLIKAFGGFEYLYNQLLISTEFGLSENQSYQRLTFSFLF